MRKKFLSAFMLGALTLAATSTFVSCKDYDGDIQSLKSDVSALQNSLNDLKTKHDADIAALNSQIAAAKKELQDAIDKKADKTEVALLANRVASLEAFQAATEAKLATIEQAIKDLQDNKADKSDVESKYAALTGMIQDVDGKVIALTGTVEQIAEDLKNHKKDFSDLKKYTEDNFKIQKDAIDAAVKRIDALEEMLSDYPEVKAQVATNKNDIAALAGRVTTAENDIDALEGRMDKAEDNIAANASAISELQSKVNELKAEIDKVNGRVDVLEVLVSKRLTSLNFMPDTFIDGVEAINFASLQYTDWNQGKGDGDLLWLANNPAGKVVNRIDDGTATAVYYVSPSSVDESSVEGGWDGLSFISSTASNLLSKAGDGAVISVVPGKQVYDKATGKLTLKLTKNTATINNSNKDFTIVSLKAPIAEAYKTTAEKGTAVNVYSDWARLQETAIVPYIHNNQKGWTDGKKAYCEKEYAHYYAFGEVYNAYEPAKANGKQAVKFTGYQRTDEMAPYYIGYLKVEPVAYDQTLDVAKLVNVCDDNGNIIDYAAYGLSFEFRMLDEFNVLDGGATETYTNQQKYASITKEGILTPNDRNGNTGAAARDAMDKTPVVQVILRDKKNNAVVDVRYIVVKIVEKVIEPQPIGVVIDGVDRFDCGNDYVVTVTSDDMNKMASLLNLNSGLEFTHLYTFDDVLYSTDFKNVIGSVATKYHEGETMQANNLKVNFFKENFPLDDELYFGGSKVVTGYVKIFSLAYGRQCMYYLPVTLKVTFDASRQNAYNKDFAKIANYWKGDFSYLVANPTLRSNIDDAATDYDASGYYDTQLIYNILNAYAKGTVSPNDVEQVVTNIDKYDGDEAWFSFDESRMKEVTGLDLVICEEPSHPAYQILYKKGTNKEIAAILWKHTGKIQLWENKEECLNTNTANQTINNAGIHGVPSALAKYFVDYTPNAVDNYFQAPEGTKNGIPVKVMAKQCGHIATIDQFIVRFETPLVYNWIAKELVVKDQMDMGSAAETKWNDWFTLQEAFGRTRFLVGPANVDANHANLKKWYGFHNNSYANCSGHADMANWIYPEVDLANAMLNGQKLSAWKDQYGGEKYMLKYSATHDDAKYGSDAKFIFYNNSGNAITEQLVITVPVTVKTKWKNYSGTITIKVGETTTTAKQK